MIGWTLTTLQITPVNDYDFVLTAIGANGSATEAVTVTPLAPTLAPVAVTGVENAALALNLGATVNKLTGDTNSMASLVVSALPVGTKLTDGTATHTFTATAGNTSVDINGWTLSNLKITPATDTNFTLSIAATAKDANGDLSAITTATDLVTVNPLAATMTWAGAPSAGVEGSPLALGTIAVTLHSSAGDTNNLASLVVSAIPIGATLSDGTNTFTASAGNTSVDINGWTLTSLKITPATDTNFTLSVAATEKDAEGNLSTTTTATEVVTVNPLAPTVTWAVAPSAGLEGSTIALGSLAVTVNGLAGEANSLTSLVVSAIPVGATLSDGANTFTATAGHTSVNVGGWALSSLTITPSTDVNFTLSAAATVKDAEGNLSTAVTTEAVTVTPLAPTLAPVAVTGVENAALALNLGATVNKLTGDTNSMASLVVSALPVGTKLTDGTATHTFTATAGNTSVDINGWTLSNLKITPATDTNFTLSIAATAKDANGDLSAITTATDLVTVNPLAATMTWAGAPSAGVEGSPLALGTIAVTLHSSAGDTNNLASLVVSAIPIGATLSDGTDTFTASAGNTSVDINGWTLTSLKITPATDTNFTLSVAATEKDAEGNLSTTTTATEVVTVNPLAPTVTWAVAPSAGLEGSTIALGSLAVTVNGLAGEANSLTSLVVSAIPVGATLSDGANTFTATAGHTSVNVGGWALSSLTITPSTDVNFTLSAAATVKDAEGNLSTAVTTEAVTVTPLAPTLAPVAVTGVENAALALNLGATVNKLTGDTNSMASLVVSALPVGTKLTDGTATHTFTATAGNTSVDINGWTLSNLKITPATDTNFTLSIAATAKDANGDLSAITTATDLVTVNPLAATMTWAGAPSAGVEGSPLALGTIAVTLHSSAGDTNNLASLVVSAIPIGATLSDGTNTFTASAGNTSVDINGWTLTSLKITPATDTNFTLSVAATEKDAEGNLRPPRPRPRW